MQRLMCKSKINRARVTESKLYYEGSITIDSLLLKAADILPGEKVENISKPSLHLERSVMYRQLFSYPEL